jgi:hypothetical protein
MRVTSGAGGVDHYSPAGIPQIQKNTRVFMQFSIVIPVYNEAGNVAPLVAEISRAMEGAGAFEIICVDDGSDDATG